MVDEDEFYRLLKEKEAGNTSKEIDKRMIDILMNIYQSVSDINSKVDPSDKTMQTIETFIQIIKEDQAKFSISINAIVEALSKKLELLILKESPRPSRLEVIRGEDGRIKFIDVEYINN